MKNAITIISTVIPKKIYIYKLSSPVKYSICIRVITSIQHMFYYSISFSQGSDHTSKESFGIIIVGKRKSLTTNQMFCICQILEEKNERTM
jgi:uncharacterized protein YlxP (DUF503 family)